ncbi:hypothetical protein D9758_010919 [Tetrapyrgos nigripes]|uniref:DUF6593 domain-containing protein n=1 Tax=Tetrapyrgos nigripes TaxID=182062 RepID=A0A8H5FTA9_9AGAR|nr:hypothetical protein D9758_010919 [Tetrapyrgos nigripes]
MSFNLYQTYAGLDPLLNNTYKDDNGNVIYVVHTPWSLPGTGNVTTVKKTKTMPVLPSRSSPSLLSDAEFYSNSTITQAPTGANADTDGGRSSVDLDDASPEAVETRGEGGASNQGLEAGADSADTEGMDIVGQIEWKLFKSSTIQLGKDGDGEPVEADEYFTKESWGWWGRPRSFTGRDGKRYRWIMGFYAPEVSRLRFFLLSSPSFASSIINTAISRPVFAPSLNNITQPFIPQLTAAENPNEVVARFHRRKLALWNTPPGYLEILPAGQHLTDEILVTFLFIERLRRDKEKQATRRPF